MHFPLYVIMSLLGLPESDFGRMHALTQEMFGGDDDEYKRGGTPEEQLAVLLDFFRYFSWRDRHRRGRIGLAQRPGLMPTAVEEMIRWSTPVKEFMRTATANTTVRGVDIAEGESVYLAYVSGNRDEEVFDEPFRFDVGRNPNKHVAFGYGVHFCLGAALARMEMNSLFTELVPRLDSIELAGPPELSATTFVGGLKHLPIRYSLR